MSGIPEAAVEAAADVFERLVGVRDTRAAEKILEAAAPQMLTRAYTTGHLHGVVGAPNVNPYRAAK